MLDLLIKYAQQKGLDAEPGFKANSARRVIEINEDGTVGAVLLPIEKGGKFEFPRCPELTQPEMIALKTAAAPLLTECSNAVLFVDKEEDEPDDKQQAKHAFFIARMRELAAVVPAWKPVADVLSNQEKLKEIRDKLREQKSKSIDKVTFQVEGVFLINQPDWWEWWRVRRAELVSSAASTKKTKKDTEGQDDAAKMICFATGVPTVPLPVHPKFAGLVDVGGQANVPFVGFDKEAFCSYGLEQSANAAVSEAAAYAYRDALVDLLKNSERLAGMRITHWFSGNVRDEDDPTQLLFTKSPSTAARATNLAKDLLSQLKRRTDWPQLSRFVYYALSLSGAGGRVMVRDWMTGSFEDLAESITAWFDDFQITTLGDDWSPTPVLWRVLASIKSPNETGDKSIGSVKIPLWKAALGGRSRHIPDAAVVRILNLHRSFIVTGGIDDPSRKRERDTLYLRMGLLKAALIRKGKEMYPSLNPTYDSSAYHCGRLVAMLAALQRAANPEVDAGIAQRYYGAASSTPYIVIGRISRLIPHHVSKLGGANKEKLAFWYESRIGEIMARLGQIERLPKVFNPEQQTEFAIGYYQQLAENRTKKATNTGNAGTADAPEAEPDEVTTDAASATA